MAKVRGFVRNIRGMQGPLITDRVSKKNIENMRVSLVVFVICDLGVDWHVSEPVKTIEFTSVFGG